MPTVVTPAMGARNSAPTALSPSLPLVRAEARSDDAAFAHGAPSPIVGQQHDCRVGSSDGGMRAELWHSSRARVSMVASVAVLLLIGLGSLS